MSAALRQAPDEHRAAGTNGRPLVMGLGATGLSVARYFRRRGIVAHYLDTRQAPPGLDQLRDIDADVPVTLGKLPTALLEGASQLVVSPGIPDADPFVMAARRAGITVSSDIDLFVAEADAPIVAVTGSNGKSTVTTLLSLMCEAAGVAGAAGANLGTPALDLLTGEMPDFFLLELSSFQLQRTAMLPAAVAVLLNVSPDHLDWHATEKEYRLAKYRIFAEARGAVCNRDDPAVEPHLPDGSRRISFGLDEPADGDYGLRRVGAQRFLARGETSLLPVDELAMVGTHNQANALAALAAGELMGLQIAPMLSVLREFSGLPHRMQFVARLGGVDYINDSKATNVGAAIASVTSIGRGVILIAGGQGKGGDFDHFASATRARLKCVLLVGEDADRIGRAFAERVPTEHAGDIRSAVRRAAAIATDGDTVLLAPACASFDQYPNYLARGDDFCRAVEALRR